MQGVRSGEGGEVCHQLMAICVREERKMLATMTSFREAAVQSRARQPPRASERLI